MMFEIYAIPVSLYCAKLRILLRHKGLNWRELPPPGGYGSAEYKRIVPSGNLPAMRDGNLLLTDSEAIAEYLNEVHAVPPMLPERPAERARARERGRFHDTRLEPALRALFPYLPGRIPAPEPVLAEAAEQLQARLDQLDDLLALGPEDESGPRLSLGDCGYPITCAWIDALRPRMGFAVGYPERVAAYRARLARVPAVSEELAEYAPRLDAFLDG